MFAEFIVPKNIGRLPLSISSNYNGFKAAQWSSWKTIYSPIILKKFLPSEHYCCWLLFVRACAILTQRILRISDVQTADSLLITFCKKVEEIYGSNYCTPNMHLHLHLKDTLLDFGPPHASWCFSFERYNGVLGSIPTNNKSIEIQFMRRFLKNQICYQIATQTEDNELKKYLPTTNETTSNSLCFSVVNDTEVLLLLKLAHGPLQSEPHSYSDTAYVKLLRFCKEFVFSSQEMKDMHSLYSQLNLGCSVEYISPFYMCYRRCSYGGDIIGSVLNNRSCRSSSVIAAYWPTFGSDIHNFDPSRASIGRVHYYFSNEVTLSNSGVSAIPLLLFIG